MSQRPSGSILRARSSRVLPVVMNVSITPQVTLLLKPFNRVDPTHSHRLFEAMESLWNYKMKQKAKTTKVDFIETANLLLWPYKLAVNDAG